MKKKRVNKSKDRDKNKTDDETTGRSHRSSKRRRKSSSSSNESGTDDEVQRHDTSNESITTVTAAGVSRRSARKCVVSQSQSQPPTENENNVGNQRVTRHSKRLAAINVTPVSSAAAATDDVKDDICTVGASTAAAAAVESCSSPSKLTGKASPYSNESPRKRDTGTPDKHKAKEQDVWKVKSANGAGSGELQKLKICRQRTPEVSPAPSPPTPLMSKNELITNDAQSGTVVESTLSNDNMSVTDVGSSVEVMQHISNDDDIPVAVTAVMKNENEIDVKDICLPTFDQVDESLAVSETIAESKQTESTPASVQSIESLSNVEHSSNYKINANSVPPYEEEPSRTYEDEIVHCESVVNVTLPAKVESNTSENVDVIEEIKLANADEDMVQIRVSAQEIELEDGSQAEIVLTVDENAIDETGTMTTNIENDDEVSKTTKTTSKREEMEEVYDYERDDTKEEGELSGTEAMSPIHETFENYPADKRKRSWGSCKKETASCVVDEILLKELNIRKRTINKDDLDASDPEDLIFVKEIREENIVHEIESEANNGSYMGRDDDNDENNVGRNDNDETFSSSRSKSEEILKRRTLESDRIIDKRNKQRTNKESRMSIGSSGKTVLYITNLVRPFTINQLRELLLRTGRIVDDGFWIDPIKSKCYVQFETEDEALETRHALHGIRWPVNNPKMLNVQFAAHDDLLFAQAQTHESEIPRKAEPLIVSSKHHADNVVVEQSSQKRVDWKKHFEQYDERPRKVKDVREWDIGKPAHPDDMVYSDAVTLADDCRRNDEQNTAKKSRHERRRRHDISDDEIISKKPRKMTATAAETQPPAEAKLLDDLFRRTKASPSIYWLPLSDEQIKMKQETKRKRIEDIDKGIKKHGDDRETRRRDRDRRRSRR